MSRIQRSLRMFGQNAVLSALVFLPVFLLAIPLEGILLRGISLEGGGHFGYALFLYVAFVVPVVLGSFVHSVAIVLVHEVAPAATIPAAAFLLSPLLCITIRFMGGADGASLLLERPAAALVATIAYGLASSLLTRKRLPAESISTARDATSAGADADR